MAYNMHNRNAIHGILIDPQAFATTLVVTLIDFYGMEFVEWSPTTILAETEDDFSLQWPQANFDRLMAGIALVKSDSFYNSLPDFIEICNILSGAPATPGVVDLADAGEIAWGITEAMFLVTPESDEPFTEEIRAYIGKMCEAEGLVTPPDVLKLAIHDNDNRLRVADNFSDDPDMYGAIWQVEADKTAEINTLIKEKLTALFQQLASLPLVHGNNKELTKMMRNTFKQHKT